MSLIRPEMVVFFLKKKIGKKRKGSFHKLAPIFFGGGTRSVFEFSVWKRHFSPMPRRFLFCEDMIFIISPFLSPPSSSSLLLSSPLLFSFLFCCLASVSVLGVFSLLCVVAASAAVLLSLVAVVFVLRLFLVSGQFSRYFSLFSLSLSPLLSSCQVRSANGTLKPLDLTRVACDGPAHMHAFFFWSLFDRS